MPSIELERELPPITLNNLNEYLKELGREFRKMNGTKTHAEIILVGGAAILAKYGFRDLTYDVDAIIVASSAMKDAINRVRDKYGLPNGWLNTDFKRTGSYTEKLFEASVYYRTFSNVLTIRIITAEYLLAMKLMSCRQYKNDLSDIVGILWEHQKNGNPLLRESVEKAFSMLYGSAAVIPDISRIFLDAVFNDGNYEALYQSTCESELKSKDMLLEFERKYPHALKTENIDGIIEKMKQKSAVTPKSDLLLARLEEIKNEAK